MLKMSFDTNICPETFALLVTCVIDDALLETVPDQPLLQIIDIMNFRLADPLLHFSLNFVVNRVLGCLGQRSGEMNAVSLVSEG